MLLELIATVVMGFAAAGCVLILNWILGGRLPKWLIPLAAGAGMIGFIVWSEYSWSSRIIDTLPEEVSVVSQNEVRNWYRPWTYIWPLTNRMTLVDHRFDRRNEAFPDHVLTAVVLMGRWEPGRQVPVVFDCAQSLRADMSADVVFTDDGALEGADWLRLPEDDPALRAVCDRE
ncbi:hypothetical protein [Alkalilacustris brevis]|uniref:hypothetical protein n=1 Tax=Alkalilacustris brevis TaxID=2026338 RepID=UPI000E0CCCBA|nr:hypothetical protein [Alkalilacustris brevis]